MNIPPLNERGEDIPELFLHFLKLYAIEFGMVVPEVDPGVYPKLSECDWPGNIRQVENLVIRILLEKPFRILERHVSELTLLKSKSDLRKSEEKSESFSAEKVAGAASHPGLAEYLGFLDGPLEEIPDLQEARQRFEKQFIIEILSQCNGNATVAAKILHISRRHLGTLLARYELNPLDLRKKK